MWDKSVVTSEVTVQVAGSNYDGAKGRQRGPEVTIHSVKRAAGRTPNRGGIGGDIFKIFRETIDL